jgi:hypothetical protein
MASPQVLHLIEIDTIEQRLSDPRTPNATVEELYRFGTLLFTELQQRSSETDRKLTNVFGWSIATLAFLLASRGKFDHVAYGVLALKVAAVFSSFCVGLSAFAIKSRMWRAPSENDWFQNQLWDDAERMKRYHIVSMLGMHQAQIKGVQRKAECLGLSEILLAISGLIILCLLLFS